MILLKSKFKKPEPLKKSELSGGGEELKKPELKPEPPKEEAPVAPAPLPEPKVDYQIVTKGVKSYKKFNRSDGTSYLEGPLD